MEVIDNISKRLGDDLKGELKPGSKLKIAASAFSIYAFEALKKELAGVESLEFENPGDGVRLAALAPDPAAKRHKFILHAGRPLSRACFKNHKTSKIQRKIQCPWPPLK